MSSERIAFLLCGVALHVGCGAGGLRTFPNADPVWSDDDRRAFAPPLEPFFSGFYWDGADQMLFRPVSRVFAVDVMREAVDVNAFDEVPDSSWYRNRLARRPLTPEEVALAACAEAPPLDPNETWTITSAKPNGANPGFIAVDSAGNRYLLKFDADANQPERATAADVIGSRLYWAFGYHTPCNRLVSVERDVLSIAPDATYEAAGRELPLTWEVLEPAFEGAVRDESGRIRATASLFLPGRPLGPWRYEGTREDDPNDVVPHEQRRELRGGRLLAAWLNHFDSREQNTLSIWRDVDGTNGYVEHYYIDFGECFGSLWGIEGISRRLGHSSYFDVGHVLTDLVTLGLVPRPWHDAHFGASGAVLGYFDVERFDPDAWHPGYPNPSFLRATERDDAWMARQLADLGPEQVRAVVDAGQFSSRVVADELYTVLLGRREKILQRHLHTVSPLARPWLEAPSRKLCLRDLAVTAGLYRADARPYAVRARRYELSGDVAARVLDHSSGVREQLALTRRNPDVVCAQLPAVARPSYLVVELTAMDNPVDPRARPLLAHLYAWPDGTLRLVGLERP